MHELKSTPCGLSGLYLSTKVSDFGENENACWRITSYTKYIWDYGFILNLDTPKI